eukprot:95072-Rhodomonas_salina.1
MDAEARDALLEAAGDGGARGQVEVVDGRGHLLVHLLHQVAVAPAALQRSCRPVAAQPRPTLLHQAAAHQAPHLLQSLLRSLLHLGLLLLLLLVVLL